MDPNIVCPVCTLYLRPGITLKSHLSSHPKQKVIEALVRLSETDEPPPKQLAPADAEASTSAANPGWNQAGGLIPPMQGNHLFIYQQSMSSTRTPPAQNLVNVNPLTQQQQYVIPTLLNPQMMPYIYQQQQLIMSSGSCLSPMRPLPYEPASVNNLEEPDGEKEPAVMVVMEPAALDDLIDSSAIKTPDQQEEPHDDLEDTPSQSGSDWNLRVRSDLNKACQTQTNMSPTSLLQDEELLDEPDKSPDNPDYYMVNNEQNYQIDQPVYAPNMLQPGDNLDFVDMDGMHMMNDFGSNQIISQVENFEGSAPDRPGVLMTIGGMVDSTKDDLLDHRDESLSRESTNVNIRADERMPPRGELSGQESMGGASDITWNRVHYNDTSVMSASYDLLARENWEASDSSDVEAPPLQSRIPPPVDYNQDNDTPTIVSFSGPPLNFKCSTCDEAFTSSAERRSHIATKHGDKNKPKTIGSELKKKKVKKLVVKFKTDRKPPDAQNNFSAFTNKLKEQQANGGDGRVEDSTDVKPADGITTDPNIALELKTVCSICDCVLANARALRRHKQEVHNITSQTRHKCQTCDEVFPTDYVFSQHLRIHPLECKICAKLFYRRQNIQLHMRRHLGIKPYKCDVCTKSFLTKQKLDEHRNIHTGEAPIKCNMCDETFRRHSNLVQHRNRHHLNVKRKVKDYICFCKEIFHSKKKLAWHKEIHDPKPKSCTQCSEKFIHMSSLTRHMRRVHNNRFLPQGHKNSENVECPICKGVYLKSSLEVHIRNHSGRRPFTCTVCNKDFTTNWNLKLHKWTHASRVSKPFKCDQCYGAFIRESDYIAHMNSHKSIRPYTCNYCGAQFIRKYNCQRHVKEHENEKTFSCKVCGKNFHRSYYLKDHMRIHSGVRPYCCHICGKTSTTKSNHNKHVQIHHAREPVGTEN